MANANLAVARFSHSPLAVQLGLPLRQPNLRICQLLQAARTGKETPPLHASRHQRVTTRRSPSSPHVSSSGCNLRVIGWVIKVHSTYPVIFFTISFLSPQMSFPVCASPPWLASSSRKWPSENSGSARHCPANPSLPHVIYLRRRRTQNIRPMTIRQGPTKLTEPFLNTCDVCMCCVYLKTYHTWSLGVPSDTSQISFSNPWGVPKNQQQKYLISWKKVKTTSSVLIHYAHIYYNHPEVNRIPHFFKNRSQPKHW